MAVLNHYIKQEKMMVLENFRRTNLQKDSILAKLK